MKASPSEIVTGTEGVEMNDLVGYDVAGRREDPCPELKKGVGRGYTLTRWSALAKTLLDRFVEYYGRTGRH